MSHLTLAAGLGGNLRDSLITTAMNPVGAWHMIPVMKTEAKTALLVCVLISFACGQTTAPPRRDKGISLHMLPNKVAQLGGRKWGFTVTSRDYLKPEGEQPVLQSANEVLSYVRKQDASVRENGVWIVVTDPDAYSDSEKALLEQVKSLCRSERIPLFICRAKDLPSGWKRYDLL